MAPHRIPMIGKGITDEVIDKTELDHIVKDGCDILSVQWWFDLQRRNPDAFNMLVFRVFSLRNNFKSGIPSVTYNLNFLKTPVFSNDLLLILSIILSKVPNGVIKNQMDIQITDKRNKKSRDAIIVTGPTGCGKSTIIRSLAQHDDFQAIAVMTTRTKRDDDPTRRNVAEDDFNDTTLVYHVQARRVQPRLLQVTSPQEKHIRGEMG